MQVVVSECGYRWASSVGDVFKTIFLTKFSNVWCFGVGNNDVFLFYFCVEACSEVFH